MHDRMNLLWCSSVLVFLYGSCSECARMNDQVNESRNSVINGWEQVLTEKRYKIDYQHLNELMNVYMHSFYYDLNANILERTRRFALISFKLDVEGKKFEVILKEGLTHSHTVTCP